MTTYTDIASSDYWPEDENGNVIITYTFDSAYWTTYHHNDFLSGYTLTSVSSADSTMAGAARDAWQHVANISFQSASASVAEFGIVQVTSLLDEDGAATGGVTDHGFVINEYSHGISVINSSQAGTGIGSAEYKTYLHEFGHALGLDHPGHTEDGGNIAYDMSMTVMSYNEEVISPSVIYPVTPMVLDIEAIQYMYGAKDYNPQDTYTYDGTISQMRTIWDTGGFNTIDASGYSGGATIDLRQGVDHYSVIGNSYIWLANDHTNSDNSVHTTHFFNATGGSGDDTITGNEFNNVLNGGGGNDTLSSGAGVDTFNLVSGDGNDHMNGGSGLDIYNLPLSNGGPGHDTIDELTGSDGFVLKIGPNTILDSSSLTSITNTDGSNHYTITGGVVATSFIPIYDLTIDGNDITLYEIGRLSSLTHTFISGTGWDTSTDSITITGAGSDPVSHGIDPESDLTGTTSADTMHGTAYRDIIHLDAGDDTAFGNAGNDTLYGELGADSLYGGDGDDKLIGGAGADTMDGGNGIDIVDYSASSTGVTVNLATNTNTGGDAAGDSISNVENITGSSHADNLTGNSADNLLSGGADNDTLTGGDGNDTFIGGAGADTIDGGNGTDTVDYSASSAAVTVNLTTNTNTGGDAASDSISNVENIIGSAFADHLTGNSSDNHILGGAGNDTLTGSDGNDTLIGGAGADTIDGGNGVDTVDYSASSAAVTVNLATNTNTGGDAASDSISNVENIIGSAFGDTLTGTSSDNSISGGTGVDYYHMNTITPGATDVYETGIGIDTITDIDSGYIVVNDVQISGTFTYSSSEYDSTFTMSSYQASFKVVESGNDLILSQFARTGMPSGSAGAWDTSTDKIILKDAALDPSKYGLTLVNTISGNSGDNNISGSHFNDTIHGNDGDDNLHGDRGNDIIYGDNGADSLWGDTGENYLYGGNDNDTFFDGSGIDHMDGGAGTSDLAYYQDATGGVTVNLLTGHGSGAEAEGDTYVGIEKVIGSIYDDVLIGDAADNNLNGYNGNDEIHGGVGNDFLAGGIGNDHIYGDDGDDQIIPVSGTDYVDGGDGIDKVVYSGSAITLNFGTNVNTGGDAAGDSIINVESASATSNDDTLIGNSANNFFWGNGGNDTLVGADGADTLYGGVGADTFTFNSLSDSTDSAKDVLMDFSHADGDKIDLAGLGFSHVTDFSITQSGGYTEVDDPSSTFHIQLLGTITLVDSDFIFS